MTAIILAFCLTFAATTGYAYGTTREDASARMARQRPAAAQEVGKKAENLEKIDSPDKYEDGEYTGTAEGYAGPVTVKVTVKGGKIVDLVVVSHNETPGYYESGAQVIDRVLKAGNLDVDTISGATLTSHAILAAAANALGKPSKDKPKTAAGKGKGAARGGAAPSKAGGEDFSGKSLKDGTYQGSAQGYASALTVAVTISGGKITDVRFVSGNDDQPYLSQALTLLPKIVANQGTKGVDSVSGATYSSVGLINATNNALRKAVSGGGGGGFGGAGGGGDNLASKRKIEELEKEIKRLKAQPKVDLDEGSGEMKDGTWKGKAPGYNGNVEVAITVAKGKITKAVLVSHNDDAPYMDKAKPILANIVKQQGTKKVDTVSGATFSSNGILNAAKQALRQARGMKEQAGPVVDDAQIKRLQDEIAKLKKQAENKDKTEDVTAEMKDGEFSAKAHGYNGPVEVKLKVVKGKITEAKLGEHGEDAEYLNKASAILPQIVKNNGTKGIDAVSGATFSSNAILNATRKAMAKAAGQEVSDSDGDSAALNAEIARLKEEIERLKKQSGGTDGEDVTGAMKDGDFSASARGYNGPVEVKITVKDGKITSASLGSHSDDAPYINDASGILDQIVSNNGTKGVDTVTGATYSSKGILNAVRKAMAKAAGEDVGDDASDGDTSALDAEIERLKEEIERLKSLAESNDGEDVTGTMKDGEYSATARGYNGPVEVRISVKGGKITSASLGSHNDDAPYINDASAILDEIVKNNGTKGVDTVSGATYSSNGILNAARRAMEKAVAGGSSGGVSAEEFEELKASKDKLKAFFTAYKKDLQAYLKAAAYEEAYTPPSSDPDNNEPGDIDETVIELKDGSYTGIGRGWMENPTNPPTDEPPYNRVGVTVTIKDGVIDSIDFRPNGDTKPYFPMASNSIGAQVLGKKSTADADIATGATYSSRGIIEAIDMALFKARYGQAGADAIEQLAQQVKDLEEENKQLKDRIVELEGRIKELEGTPAPADPKEPDPDASTTTTP